MARASTKTLLTLDRFAAIVGINPLHFNQVELPNLGTNAQVCGMPILQYNWQDADRVGREEIAQAIAIAEDSISAHLGFKLLPTWEEETITTPRGRYSPIRTTWKHVISGGQEGKSLIDDAVAIAYTDVDGDGYKETATITVSTTVTDTDEIAVYYPGKAGDDEYEVRPITVSIASGTATITCRREQLVVLSRLDDMIDPRSVDGQDDDQFLEEVDIYRRYNDPSVMASIISYGGCCGNGCSTCQYSSQSGCIYVADSRNGIVSIQPATWDADDATYVGAYFCNTAAKATLHYRAGISHRDTKLKLVPEWERAVAYYAMTLLDRPLCKCNSIAGFADYWRQDFTMRARDVPAFVVSDAVRNCPLGSTRGALNAWRLIQRDAVGESLADSITR